MNYKVCVIEDEEIIRTGLINAIDWDSIDCQIVGEAGNGEAAIKVITAQQPDIIILDINMPLMDGIEVLSKLPKGIYSVIIISGYSDFNYAKKAIEFGVCEYLLKPLDHQELIQSIQRAKQEVQMYRHLSGHLSVTPQYQALVIPSRIDSTTVKLAIDYVKDNYMNKITLDQIRAVTGRSVTHINKRFQSNLGMTFNEFVSRFRIEQALKLMRSEKVHLYEIAELVGFNDYKYFNSVFQKYIGVTPKLVLTHYARS